LKRNRLRELLDEGKPTFGTHVICPWPGIIEIIGHSGTFDYIEYVGEYSPFSLEQLDNFGRTIELFPDMSSMIKIEEHSRGFIATRAIGAGIQNVLFADCRSANDVRECIRLVKPETPEAGGTHSVSDRRNVGYFLESGSEQWAKAMNEVVIAIMIEKKGAMDNLEEILSIKGIDMVQFGGFDYAVSIGNPGRGNSPEIQNVQLKMIQLALKNGVAPRVELTSLEQAKPYIEMGVRHFCVGWDYFTIYQWCQQQKEALENFNI